MTLTAEKLFTYLREQAKLGEITAESPLFTSSLLDSVSLVDLIVFVEGELDARIEPDEVLIENFDSVTQILKFAATKGGA